jgi:hypothetical protein
MHRLTFSDNEKPARPGAGRKEIASSFAFPYLGNDFRSYLASNFVSKFPDSLNEILIEGVDASWMTIDHAVLGALYLYLSEICKDKQRSKLLRITGLRFSEKGDLGRKVAKQYRNVVPRTPEESSMWVAVREYAIEVITLEAFKQCPERMRVLQNTGDAELYYTYTIARKRLYVRAKHLESARRVART